MHRLILILILIPFASAAAKNEADDANACRKGQVELARKAADYRGPDKIKRLIEADLQRAAREEAEADFDECVEALDHAAKLIAGKF